jgi:hypothetical protein
MFDLHVVLGRHPYAERYHNVAQCATYVKLKFLLSQRDIVYFQRYSETAPNVQS